ncbi:M3 family metallopeptidase [Streptomyces sp. NPDC056347]|uniref:M3 family metallopeptidase n=1 Tax=Streptomyces sp. NPDC056347 TaxID=3345790 RepID=UPI0035D8CE4E
MPIEQFSAADRQSIAAVEESLDGMLTRLHAIVAEPALSQDTLVEIMSIYNNVAYVFLYLEAIDDEDNHQRLLPKRALFHEDAALDARLLDLMSRMHCDEPEVEEARLEFVDQLCKGRTHDPAPDRRINELLCSAKQTLDRIREDQSGLLERLGVGTAAATNPAAVFYKLTGQTKSEATREKLARAWQNVRDGRLDELVPIIDEMVAVRRADSAAAGYESALARSIERSRVGTDEIRRFLDDYLVRAVASHSRLEDEIRTVTGIVDRPMDHFAFAMNSVFGTSHSPLFELDECLSFIFAVAESVFGLTMHRVADTYADVPTYDVHNADGLVGQITFDLWNRDRKIAGNYTQGIRNRTDWSDVVQRPVAYVACRFQTNQDGARRITFQNVHSLFHEFGHAVNHLLIRKRLSYQSGLEYLPPERLECLSMWFEKWVYHVEFARHLSLPADDANALERCGRIKMIEYRRTYVERAVSAALDFELHSSPSGGYAEAYRRLDERLGISRFTTYGDFPAYFTWPMYMAKPGANFSYLWGSADSSRKFASFKENSLAEIAARPGLRELFTPSFDFDAPSEAPDPTALFSFYDTAPLGTAGQPA